MTEPIRVLSLGAGVQSTTLLLMSLYGDIEPFDHVIFSDTGWEPTGVYEHLERLKTECSKFGVPLDVVRAGNIRDDHVAPTGEHLFIRNAKKRPDYQGKQRTFIPFYVVGGDGKKGRTFRTCTMTYKIEPVEKRLREILGLKRNQRWPLEHVVDQALGISWDEAQRVRLSQRPAVRMVYPLIESRPGLTDVRMTRDDCHAWLADHGWTSPRSACIGCPFHRNDEWRRMRDEDPDAWKDAIEFDEAFRERVLAGKTAIEGIPYLHDSRVPLREANIDAGTNQPSMFGGTIFGDQCEGFCGT